MKIKIEIGQNIRCWFGKHDFYIHRWGVWSLKTCKNCKATFLKIESPHKQLPNLYDPQWVPARMIGDDNIMLVNIGARILSFNKYPNGSERTKT